MRVIFVILVCAFLGDYTLAQNDGNCDITEISSSTDWVLKRIDTNDTQVNAVIFQSAYTGTLIPGAITATQESGNINDLAKVASYFQFTNDSNTLVLSTTSAFGNLDEDAFTNGSATLVLNIQCPLTCDGGSSVLRMMISVEDTNNHAPTFSMSLYEYKVPMPIMQRIDFTIYGDAIEASDLDFSNNAITFSVTPADFTITSTQVDTKRFRAVFSTTSTLQLTANKTYALTATDSGTPQNSTTTTLTLMVDSEASLDSPSFQNNPYRFNYSVNSDGDGVLDKTEDITATTNRPSVITDVSLTGDYGDYFTIEPTAGDNEVTFTLSVKEPLPSEADSVIVLTLSFQTDAIARTTLLVYTSSTSSDIAPEFGSLYYVGSYNSADHTVTLESDITVTSASETVPSVTVSGENSDNFKVTCVSTTCQLQVAALSSEILSATSELLLTLTATEPGGTNSTQSILIVRLPPQNLPTFSKLYYSASYLVNGTEGTVKLDDEIMIDNIDAAAMTIEFGDYQDKFNISYTDNKWSITVKDLLSEDIIKYNSILNIILTAKEKTNSSITSSAVLGLKLPKENTTEAPAFDSLYYTGQYNKTDNTVKLDKEIKITSSSTPTVTISGDSADYFQVVCVTTSCTLTAKSLPDDVLTSSSELLLKLTATEADSSSPGEAVLIIKLPQKTLPSFSKLYYTGNYTASNKTGSIILADQINIENIDSSSVTITLDSYTEYFEAAYENNVWTVNVHSPLSEDILNSYSELIITLTATSSADSSITTKAVLVLKLPSVNTSEAPKFTKVIFEAEYVTNSTPPQVLGDDITVTSSDNSVVKVSLDSKYASNFKIEYSSTKSSWNIAILEPLNDTVLNDGENLIVTLTASEEGNSNIAQAGLIIKLPTLSENEEAPKFSDVYYLGEYKLNDDNNTAHVEMKANIEISNKETMSSIAISLDSYTSNFAVVWDETTKLWNVEVAGTLDDNTLQFNTELRLIMTAKEESNTNTGNSVLILSLPIISDNSTDVPVFSKLHYSADYLPTNKLNMSDIIQVKHNGTELEVTIMSGSNSEYFDITQVEDHYELIVKTVLPDDVLQDEVSVVLTLEAKSTTASAYATVVVNLPKATETANVPAFSQVFYAGKYLSTNTVEINDTISVTYEGGDASVSITQSTYSDNFDIQQNGDHYTLSVKTPLPDDVLQTEISVVITLIAHDETNDVSGYSTVVINLPIKVNTSVISFGNVLYNVEYNPENEDLVVATLSVNVDSEDDLEVSLSDDNGLSSYFEATYSNGSIKVTLKEALPDSVVANNSFITLKLTAGIQGTTDTTSVVVNVRIIGGGTSGSDGSSTNNTNNTTGYIAAISVLAVLLVAVIAAVIVLWYLKIRTKSYSQMEDSPQTQVKFSKNLNRQNSDLRPPSAIEARRPTGFVFKPNLVDPEEDEVDNNQESSSDFNTETKERRKSVAFDPNVEKMQIESANDGDCDSISNNEYTSDTDDGIDISSRDHQTDNGLTEATNIPDTYQGQNRNMINV